MPNILNITYKRDVKMRKKVPNILNITYKRDVKMRRLDEENTNHPRYLKNIRNV